MEICGEERNTPKVEKKQRVQTSKKFPKMMRSVTVLHMRMTSIMMERKMKIQIKKPVSRIPHGNMWRRKEDSKDVEDINISNISEVSKDNDEHNSAINKDDIHYEEKQDGDIKEYTDKDEGDEEGCSDDCGILL